MSQHPRLEPSSARLEPSSGLSSPRVDVVAVAAAICIVLGWFALSTVDTELGGLRLSFHFYDMWSVLERPTRLLTGLTDGDRVRGVLFGALCLLVLVGVFVPHRSERSGMRVAYLAPLVLMVVCGVLLYEKSSADLLSDTSSPGSLGSQLTAFANGLASRLSRTVTRHISLGLGAYLAFLASLILAARGLSRARPRAR